MNFFTKTKFLVAVIIVLSAIILAVFGTMGYHYFRFEGEAKGRPRESKQMAGYMAKQLQLTPEQVTQIDTLRERFHKESNALLLESRSVSKEIMAEITSDSPDIPKLKTLAQKFGKLQEDQKQMMINHLLEVKSKCSASQQMNFKRFIRQMENHERMARERSRASRQKE
jgi:Spy/CpxP family protein refolding chaperone